MSAIRLFSSDPGGLCERQKSHDRHVCGRTLGSDASAAAAASRLLRINPDVINYLASLEVQATNKAMAKASISKQRILDEEGTIAFIDPKDIFDENGAIKDIKDLPEAVRRAIKKVTEQTVAGMRTVRFEFYDKGKALDRLEKCLKMQSEGVTIDGGLTLTMIIKSVDGKNRGKLPQQK